MLAGPSATQLPTITASALAISEANAVRSAEHSYKGEGAPVRIGEIAVPGIPGPIAFEEGDVVTTRGKGLEQRAPRRGVAVVPRRGEAEAENIELHAAALSPRAASAARSSRSTFAPRRV
jgi:hypothetical protein